MPKSEDSIGSLAVSIASKGSLAQLDACLTALRRSQDQVAQPVAVVVARPTAAEDASPVLKDHPWVELVLVEGNGSIPVLRGAAMQASETDWVVLTEDMFLPHADWLAAIEMATKTGADVIGGSVGNVQTGPINHAAYLTDYGTFSPSPPAEEPVAALTGANVAYGPTVRAKAAGLAAEGAWEHVIHERLASGGAKLHFEPSARVDHNATYALTSIMRERYHHAYEYAQDRLREGDPPRRLLRLLKAPLLPPLMILRLIPAAKASGIGHFLRAVPTMLALYCAWSAGETIGFLKGIAPER